MRLSDTIYESDGNSRVTAISLDNKTLVTPTYFPAVSSFGVKHAVPDLINLLTNHSYPRLLVSAYDLERMDTKTQRKTLKVLRNYIGKGILFLDSGMYESYWYRDESWDFEKYSDIVKRTSFDIFSSLNSFPSSPSLASGLVRTAIKRIEDSSNVSERDGFVPIIHALHPDKLVSMTKKILATTKTSFSIIAVPERDCGVTLQDKAQTIMRLKKVIGEFKEDMILHILGCGHPKSIAIYTLFGADTYDSLDWIKYLINPNDFFLEDFAWLDLINCECVVCKGEERTYVEKVLLHNLFFYQSYMKSIRNAIRNDEMIDFVKSTLSKTQFDFVCNLLKKSNLT